MTRARVKVGIILALCLVMAAGILHAAELRVPEDCLSIQEAVDAASSGDTIIIGPGTYYDNPVLIDAKSDLTIRSSDPTLTSIRGTIYIRDSSGITIEGFTISAPYSGEDPPAVYSGDGIYFESTSPEALISGIVIVHNTIVDCARNGLNFEAAYYSDVLIQGNVITRNGFDAIRLIGHGRRVRIVGNQITSNGQANVRGCGIRIARDIGETRIEDNFIVDNPFAGIHPQ